MSGPPQPAAVAGPAPTERVWTPGACALVVLGAVLRGWDLGRQSFWHDEIHSIFSALTPRGIAYGGSFADTVLNPHGPLYLLLLAGWIRMFGEGETAVRALSALLGTIGLLVFHPLAVRLVGGRAARIALVLLALSPFHLWYSQEARNYALLFVLGVLAVRTFLTDASARTPRSFALALLATCGACLANLSGFFLFVLQAAWLAFGRPRLEYPVRRFLLFGLLAAVLLSPWIASGAGTTGRIHLRTESAGAPVPIAKGEAPPGALSVPYAFYDFALGHSLGPAVDELKQHRMRAVWPHLPVLLPAALVFGLAALSGVRSASPRRRWLLLVWIAIPVLLMAGLSFVNLKAPNSRYAFLAFPPFLLLLGSGVAALRSGPARAALLAAMLAVLLASDYRFYRDPGCWKPDVRSAGKLLAAESREDDAIVVYALDYPLLFYVPPGMRLQVPPPATFASDSAVAAWHAVHTHPGQRVWTVQCQSWWVDRDDRFVTVSRRLLPLERAWSFPHLPVHRFVRPVAGTP